MTFLVSFFLALAIVQTAPSAGAGGIVGRVVADGTNAPIAGARIIAFPAARPTRPIGPPPQTITDQEGRFAFPNLAPGEYRLDVQKTGFAPLSDPMTQPRSFTVAEGQVLSVELRLQRGGVISGRVLDATGEPLSDVQVMAMRRMAAPTNGGRGTRLLPAPMQGPQQTNDLGEFRLSGLAPGEYAIAAARRGFPGFGGPGVTPGSPPGAARTTTVTTFYPGTADQTAAQPVTVAAGAEVGNIVFMMQSAPAFRVSGIVVDETGAPIENAMVTLMADPRSGVMTGPFASGQADARGRFTIDEVPPGSYRANASVMMTIRSGPGGAGTASAGFVGGSSFFSFSSGPVGGIDIATEVAVTDADVKDVRIVTRRPNPQ